MRALVLAVWLSFCGCGEPVTAQRQREVVDNSGTNLLDLVNLVAGRAVLDFDSLVWKRKVGTNWIDQRVISKAAFQAGRAQLRWVNDIDSFNSSNGTAVIKVGEESVPITNGSSWTINVVYSWREWSLLTNGEIRVLRVCHDPFEKYTR